MNSVFQLIVQLFEAICRFTGLRYAELNILCYCLLLPFTWAVIVAFRHRKHLLLPVLHLISLYLYLSLRGELNIMSRRLYERNVAWLEYFGNRSPQGYIYISLIIGVLAPIIMYGLLLFLPKSKIAGIYVIYMFSLIIYQFFVWKN